MKLTITKFGKVFDVNTKYGPKKKSAVMVSEKEYENKYLSYWCSKQTDEWKVGQVIEVENVTTEDKNGKTYYNLVLPKQNGNTSELKVEIMALRTEMQKNFRAILDHLSGVNPLSKDKVLNVHSPVDYPERKGKEPDFSEVDDAGLDYIEPPFN